MWKEGRPTSTQYFRDPFCPVLPSIYWILLANKQRQQGPRVMDFQAFTSLHSHQRLGKLPPEGRSGERILQENLGSFPWGFSDQSDDADFVRSRETMWAGVNKQERWTARIWNKDIHKLQPSLTISIHFMRSCNSFRSEVLPDMDSKNRDDTSTGSNGGRSTCGAWPRQFRCI